jgi:hypothetical protein
LIKRCVNRDVARKIVGYIKVDLTHGILYENTVMGLVNNKNICYWHKVNHTASLYAARPCVFCLRPTGIVSTTCSSDPAPLRCLVCVKKNRVVCGHSDCCIPWFHSIETQCLKKLLDNYEV